MPPALGAPRRRGVVTRTQPLYRSQLREQTLDAARSSLLLPCGKSLQTPRTQVYISRSAICRPEISILDRMGIGIVDFLVDLCC